MKYKCKNCGSNQIVECQLINNVKVSCYNGDCSLRVEKQPVNLNVEPGELKALVCEKCGHVEWFHTYPEAVKIEEAKRKERERIEKEQEHERKVQAHEHEVGVVENQIGKAKAILKNENSTLRQAKEAKQLIKQKEEELRKLKVKKI